MSIADQLGEELRLRARGELAEARLPDFQALMKQKAQALIGLERIEQAIDEVIKGTNLQNYPIPGLGRLSNTASRIYAFLEQIVRYGLLPRKDLDDGYKRAPKAGNQ